MCRRICPSWTKPYLEKEARNIWQKYHKNPKPTNKGTIWEVFYMRIKALYKKSGVEEQVKKDSQEAKKDRSERDNCLRREQGSAEGILGRPTLLRSQVSLKSHGEPAGRAKELGRGFIKR